MRRGKPPVGRDQEEADWDVILSTLRALQAHMSVRLHPRRGDLQVPNQWVWSLWPITPLAFTPRCLRPREPPF